MSSKMTILPVIVRDKKQVWLIHQLKTMGIHYGLHPKSGQIGIRLDDLKQVMDILYTPLSSPSGLPPVRITDIDNQNDMFEKQYWPIINEVIMESLLPESDEWFIPVTSSVIDLPFMGQIQQLEMYDIDSSNLSALGFVPYEKNGAINKFVVFTRFKGALTLYAYYPIDRKTVLELVKEINRKYRFEAGASVGHLFHTTVRINADTGSIKCNKLDPATGHWTKVVAKK